MYVHRLIRPAGTITLIKGDLYRTTEPDDVFFYTSFKGVATVEITAQ